MAWGLGGFAHVEKIKSNLKSGVGNGGVISEERVLSIHQEPLPNSEVNGWDFPLGVD